MIPARIETRQFHMLLDQAYNSEDEGAAEKFLVEQAAGYSHENCGRNLGYLMCMSELGSYYRSTGKCDASIQAFKTADELIVSLLGEKSPERAVNLNNMAGAYRMKGDLDTALQLFLKAIGIYDALPEKNPFQYSSALNNTALLYHLRGLTQKALELQKQSVDLLKKVPDAQADLVTGLANLAYLCAKTNDLNEAVCYMEQADDLAQKIFGGDHSKTKEVKKELQILKKLIQNR